MVRIDLSLHFLSLLQWVSGICRLIVFAEIGKRGALFLKMTFTSPPLPPFPRLPITRSDTWFFSPLMDKDALVFIFPPVCFFLGHFCRHVIKSGNVYSCVSLSFTPYIFTSALYFPFLEIWSDSFVCFPHLKCLSIWNIVMMVITNFWHVVVSLCDLGWPRSCYVDWTVIECPQTYLLLLGWKNKNSKTKSNQPFWCLFVKS